MPPHQLACLPHSGKWQVLVQLATVPHILFRQAQTHTPALTCICVFNKLLLVPLWECMCSCASINFCMKCEISLFLPLLLLLRFVSFLANRFVQFLESWLLALLYFVHTVGWSVALSPCRPLSFGVRRRTPQQTRPLYMPAITTMSLHLCWLFVGAGNWFYQSSSRVAMATVTVCVGAVCGLYRQQSD